MTLKSTYEQGICNKDECGGFIQFEKVHQYYYCMNCMKKWQEDEWETLVQITREQEYDYRDVDRNLADLNSL